MEQQSQTDEQIPTELSTTPQESVAPEESVALEETAAPDESAVPQESALLKNSRKGFVRKVFSIVAAQISLTAMFVVASQISQPFIEFHQRNKGLATILGLIASIISLCLFFKESLAKRVPRNYYLLTIQTICWAYVLSEITLRYHPTLVLQAALLTVTSVLVTFAYAVTTKKDITVMGSIVFILVLATPVLSLLNYFIFQSSHEEIIIHAVGIAIICFYLIYDIQQIMGSSRFKLGLDNYILGSLMIYLDIIHLFIKYLQILAEEKAEGKGKEKAPENNSKDKKE